MKSLSSLAATGNPLHGGNFGLLFFPTPRFRSVVQVIAKFSREVFK
jgi:hypothetical protein